MIFLIRLGKLGERAFINRKISYLVGNIYDFRNMDSVEERHLLRLGMGGDRVFGKDKDFSFGRMGRVNYLLKRRLDLLEKAKVFAK